MRGTGPVTKRAPSRKTGLSRHMDRRVPPTSDIKPMRAGSQGFRAEPSPTLPFNLRRPLHRSPLYPTWPATCSSPAPSGALLFWFRNGPYPNGVVLTWVCVICFTEERFDPAHTSEVGG